MNAYEAYAQQATTTASPAQLVLMLYDGALARIEAARDALDRSSADLETAHEALTRAQRIVRELQVTLDHERGGDVAKNLAGLYGYALDQLVDANVRKTVAPLDEAAATIRPLRDAWEQSCVNTAAAVAG